MRHPGKIYRKANKEENDLTGSSLPRYLDALQVPIDLSSSEDEEEDFYAEEDDDNHSYENTSNQLVVYDPVANSATEVEPVPDPIQYRLPSFTGYSTTNAPSRVLPSVGAFTVQCANCFKWRLIPTKEKYEEIREHILEQPFVCETAREWRPNVSCDDPADISQDGSRLWAIDKPNIAQPPAGWQRLLRIRGEGSTKFADVYYVAPSGKRLRSMVEVQKYLLEHPEYMVHGVTLSQFSFQIPKPLQENYVRKRPARVNAGSYDDTTSSGMSRPLEPGEVNPLSWAGPAECIDLQLRTPGLSAPYFEAPVFDPVSRPTKQARRTLPRDMYDSNMVYNQQKVKVEEPNQSRAGDYDP